MVLSKFWNCFRRATSNSKVHPINDPSDQFSRQLRGLPDDLDRRCAQLHEDIAQRFERLTSELIDRSNKTRTIQNERFDDLKKALHRIEWWTIADGISGTPLLLSQHQVSPVYLSQELKYPTFNPGAVCIDGQIWFLSRSSSWIVQDDGRMQFNAEQRHDTINILHRFTDDLQYLGSGILDTERLRKECRNAECGIEDARLFIWQDELWAICTAVHTHPKSGYATTQILIKIENDTVIDYIDLPSPTNARIEKNWVPVVDGARLYLIYSFYPLVVFEVVDRLLVLKRGDPAAAKAFFVRGGTPLIKWGDNHYIGLVHSAPRILDQRSYYTHSFIVLNDCFDVIEMSPPFFIERRGIEFACGLLHHNDHFLLSYGVSDRAAAFALIPTDQIIASLIGLSSPSKTVCHPDTHKVRDVSVANSS